MAQYQTIPPRPNNQVSGNIRNDNFIQVPDGGLRFVNSQNRTIAMMLEQGGNGGMVFLSSNNRPSISLMSGNTGQMLLDGGNGPAIRFTDAQGKEAVSLNMNQGKPFLKLKDSIMMVAESDGGRIFLKDPQGNNSVRIDTTPDGGRVTGYNKAQATLFMLENKDGEGTVNLLNKDGQTGFRAGGNGTAAVMKDKETIWKVPADN